MYYDSLSEEINEDENWIKQQCEKQRYSNRKIDNILGLSKDPSYQI